MKSANPATATTAPAIIPGWVSMRFSSRLRSCAKGEGGTMIGFLRRHLAAIDAAVKCYSAFRRWAFLFLPTAGAVYLAAAQGDRAWPVPATIWVAALVAVAQAEMVWAFRRFWFRHDPVFGQLWFWPILASATVPAAVWAFWMFTGAF